MALPKYNDFYFPVIHFFADEKEHGKSEVLRYLVEYFELTKKDINETTDKGKRPIFYSRVSWILSNLTKINVLNKQGRGKYVISDEGLKLVNKNPNIVNEEILNALKSKRDIKSINNSINIGIENIGVISKTRMNINKINVVGGQNSTGKSTASKLLYCFLKYCSQNRQEYAYKFVIGSIRRLFFIMRRTLTSELNDEDNRFLFRGSARLRHIDNVNTILDMYQKLKDIAYAMEFDSNSKNYLNDIFREFDSIDELLNIIEEDGESLFNLIMKDLFDTEFSNKMKGSVLFHGSFNNDNYKYLFDFSKTYDFYRKGDLLINDVLYIDSVSLLDTNQVNGLNNTNHVQSLLKAIDKNESKKRDLFKDIRNPNVKLMESKINDLIHGNFEYDQGELKYYDSDGVECYMSNTASGIKQIGIIQLLLHYDNLQENSFLIIDEPEVNLHPDWQVKLAQILILLAKDLNIQIYVNTHSPMFIEAMRVYSEYYGLLNETNFYLTNKHPHEGFYFKKIVHNNMGEVYENLAKPYLEIDRVKARMSERL